MSFYTFHWLDKADHEDVDDLEAIRGLTNQMMTASVIPEVNGALIERTWNWFDQTLRKEPKLNAGTFVLIEIMQREAFGSVKSRTETGWPRPTGRHILQIGCGVLHKNSTDEIHALATTLLGNGAVEICDNYSDGDCLPRDFEEFHKPAEVGFLTFYDMLTATNQERRCLGRIYRSCKWSNVA